MNIIEAEHFLIIQTSTCMLLFFVFWISLWKVPNSDCFVASHFAHLAEIDVRMPRFNVGAYMRKRKQMEERVICSTGKMMDIQTEIMNQELTLTKKRKYANDVAEKMRKLDAKV